MSVIINSDNTSQSVTDCHSDNTSQSVTGCLSDNTSQSVTGCHSDNTSQSVTGCLSVNTSQSDSGSSVTQFSYMNVVVVTVSAFQPSQKGSLCRSGPQNANTITHSLLPGFIKAHTAGSVTGNVDITLMLQPAGQTTTRSRRNFHFVSRFLNFKLLQFMNTNERNKLWAAYVWFSKSLWQKA
jgi:hypothetical protein